MLTKVDFAHAYGPPIAKWEARLGKKTMKELLDDWAPPVQELLVKTAGHQTAAGAEKHHTDVIQAGIATFEEFRKEAGY